MRNTLVAIMVGIVFSTMLCCSTQPTLSTPPTTPADVDVTALWTKVHGGMLPAPNYRAGHATMATTKAATAIEANGFTISLPGNFPIPTPAIYDGRLYVSGGFGTKQYFCFSAETGEQLWAVDLDDDGPSTAAIEDGVVVCNTESCTIFALDAVTGKMLWSWWLGDPLMSAPTIANGRVYASWPQQGCTFAEASHMLGAFDLKTGALLWRQWIDGDVISAPVAVGDEVIAATFTGTVFKFKQTGELVSALKARATSAPVVSGGEMLFSRRSESSGGAKEAISGWRGGVGGGAYRMDYQSNERDAKYLDKSVQGRSAQKAAGLKLDAGNGFSGGPPPSSNAVAAENNLGQGNVYTLQSFQGSRILRVNGTNVACMGDEIVCSDASNGKTKWARKLAGDLEKQGGHLGAPPVAAGASLFMTTLSGDLLQLNPANGETTKSWKIGREMRFPPAVDRGSVFIGTQDGKVVCIKTGDAKNTGWPLWGGNAQRTGIGG